MNFTVFVTARAEHDINEAYRFIAEHGPANPDSWKSQLAEKIATLESFPTRCGIAPENALTPETIYQTFYGTFRILFVIQEDSVFVNHVRHSARLPLTKEELEERQ